LLKRIKKIKLQVLVVFSEHASLSAEYGRTFTAAALYYFRSQRARNTPFFRGVSNRP
jgi:hypothetical protein